MKYLLTFLLVICSIQILEAQVEEEVLEEEDLPTMLEKKVEEETDDKIYTWTRQPPQFPGIGIPRMINFIQDTKRYPEEAAEKGIEGTVIITFIVEKDGTFTDIQVEKGIGAGCDEEALRIVKSMPKWRPGRTSRNKVVRVKYSLPIEFKKS